MALPLRLRPDRLAGLTTVIAGGRTTATVLLAAALVAAALLSPGPARAEGNEAPGAPRVYRSISVGYQNSCVRFPDGSVKCWGNNSHGQDGQGDRRNRGDDPGEMGVALVPVPLGAGRTAETVTAGDTHVCALLDDGSVKCWGNNPDGQLGLGDTENRGDDPGEMGDALPPVPLGTGRHATAVGSDGMEACAVLDDGSVKCWGGNFYGQLGQGDLADRGDQPGELGDALPPVPLGTGRTATAVAVGDTLTCALLDGGDVKCWGLNESGHLGVGDTENRGDEPGEMGDALPTVALGTGHHATALAVGGEHACALLEDGSVKCWGNNSVGQLGVGDTENRGDEPGEMGDALPTADLGPGRTALGVAAGDAHTCALLDDHTVKCWGANQMGQAGQGDTEDRGDEPGEMGAALPPVDLGPGRTAQAVTAGGFHVCAVLDDATVKCWGQDRSGQLGQGDAERHGDQPGEMGAALPPVPLTGPGVVGRVTRTDTGTALVDPLVVALTADGFVPVAGSVGNGDGRFGIATAAGTFHVYAIDQAGGARSGFHGAPTSVTVGSGPVGAHVALAPTTGRVAVTVTGPGAVPVPGALALVLGPSGAVEGGGTTDGGGQVTVAGLRPGSDHVVALDPSGAHATRFQPSAPTIDTSPAVPVVAGVTATVGVALPAQAVDPGGATLHGHVTGTGGGGVAGVSVLALRAADFSLALVATTDATGDYSLAVAPGAYRLAFLDPTGARRFEWWDDRPGSDLAGASVLAAPGQADAELVRSTGGLQGSATVGGQGRTGLWVLALSPTGVAAATTTTAGLPWSIDGLAPGTYRVGVIDPATGHVEYWPDRASFPEASTVAVAADAVATVDLDAGAPP